MTLCEKCIHGDICAIQCGCDEEDERALTYCSEFKSKDDVVEVVRCKDCKHLNVLNLCNIYAICEKTNSLFEPFKTDTREHFCSYGERKEQG